MSHTKTIIRGFGLLAVLTLGACGGGGGGGGDNTVTPCPYDPPGASVPASDPSCVAPANQAPVADAGPDQTVAKLTGVVLDGSGSSDPDGTIAGYAWTQTAGPDVVLNNADTVAPTFGAPDVAADTDLVFQLIVTDNDGATSAPDSVTITVTDPPPSVAVESE